jgi:hypothetical protein
VAVVTGLYSIDQIPHFLAGKPDITTGGVEGAKLDTGKLFGGKELPTPSESSEKRDRGDQRYHLKPWREQMFRMR